MALLLTIGFYMLALAVVVGLLGFVYAEVMYADRIVVQPTIFAIVGAGLILWSILPRWDRFVAPGPRLTAAEHPDLFRNIEEVALATQQEMPREVYLVGDVNAWVMQRGGIMGLGSRRVMGIGLPLMQSVTVAQLRAILAHEFGHYHGGDTKLGPWIYKTREAIGRTIINLAKSGSTLHKPFLWYGNFFMRVTQAISRAQELAADRLSAAVAGAKTASGALVATQRAGVAYEAYWASEVVPLLSNGFRPPLAAGLTQFLNSEQVAKSLGEHIEEELREGKSDPYDSHPPLRDRIAALATLTPGVVETSTTPASTLIRNLDKLENDLLLSFGIDPALIAKLATIRWEEAGVRAYLPVWRKQVEENKEALRDVRFSGLWDVAAMLPRFAARLQIRDVPREQQPAAAEGILGCALAVRLSDDGWVVDARPGMPVTMTKGERTIQPFSVPSRLAKGEMSAEAWLDECTSAGFADKTLA